MLHNSEKDFIKRHIGLSKKDEKTMLSDLGYKSLNELIEDTVPNKILFKDLLSIGDPNSEYEGLRKLKSISKKNQIYSNFIGMGYYGTYTPISGEVVDTNQSIVDDPSKINTDPEGDAWFFKLKVKDLNEMSTLMSREEYEKFAKENTN